jgi:hypothetical protein
MPDVQLSNPRLEGILPESAYLGRPYNSHIMAYHEEKNGSFSLKIRRLMIGEKKTEETHLSYRTGGPEFCSRART